MTIGNEHSVPVQKIQTEIWWSLKLEKTLISKWLKVLRKSDANYKAEDWLNDMPVIKFHVFDEKTQYTFWIKAKLRNEKKCQLV